MGDSQPLSWLLNNYNKNLFLFHLKVSAVPGKYCIRQDRPDKEKLLWPI